MRNEKQQAEAAAKFAEFLVYDMKFPNAEKLNIEWFQ